MEGDVSNTWEEEESSWRILLFVLRCPSSAGGLGVWILVGYFLYL
jgi:hypothetical protein